MSKSPDSRSSVSDLVGRLAKRLEGRGPVGPLLEVDPLRHRRPRRLHRARADDEPEVPRGDLHELDVRLRRRHRDRPHRLGARDLVALPHEREDRAGDVGEAHRPAVDDEAAAEHPVFDDELFEEEPQRGPRPRDEALAAEEAPAPLAPHERVPVVQLGHELDPRLDLLPRAEHLEDGARQRAGEPLDVIEEPRRRRLHRADERLGNLARSREAAVDVDRAPERDQRADPFAPTVGRRLVREHSPLRVPAQVDVAPRDRADAVDAAQDGADVIVERPEHAAGLALGRAEVDDERLDAEPAEHRHRRRVRRDVVDLER